MNVVILGAGASKSYSDSSTGVLMPIAHDFFKTFNKLDISSNRWVLIGDILNYLKRYHDLGWIEFLNYSEDIEILHSEVEEKLFSIIDKKEGMFETIDNMLVFKTYMQLIFVFTSVINEIQNGPISKSHINLAKELSPEDYIITFNWDTLMDRALKETTDWNTDNGYSIIPSSIYKNDWIKPERNSNNNQPVFLKLHGSSNWLTSYLIPEEKGLASLQETPTSDFYIYESTQEPYSTYNGRFMDGYSDFAYGYYPPNLPLKGKAIRKGHVVIQTTITEKEMPKGTASSDGLYSMPLIIPPVKRKNYEYFGEIFSTLWKKAEVGISKAKKIVIIGYSFPQTDQQTDLLFKNSFSKRETIPEIIILDPNPDSIKIKFTHDYGIPSDRIKVIRGYFNSEFNIQELF